MNTAQYTYLLHELIRGWQGFDSRQQIIFPLASASRPALGPTQPPIQRVQSVLSPGRKCGRGAKLTTHPQIVPSYRLPPIYPSSSMACSGTTFTFFCVHLRMCTTVLLWSTLFVFNLVFIVYNLSSILLSFTNKPLQFLHIAYFLHGSV
jgi:hypothetical protein